MSRPGIVPFGDAALLVVLGDRADDATDAAVRRLTALVDELADPALGAPVPAAASVLVPFDPLATDAAGATRRVRELLGRLDDAGDGRGSGPVHERLVELPTRYGGVDGPDLAAVADRHGLRPGDVVELHASAVYRVRFLGFAPGFAYLAGLPERIATPRRATPRERVPAGSVGIAGSQTGVYPFATPGGWQLIGRTDVRLWDVRRDPPALLVPGTRVRFVPIASR